MANPSDVLMQLQAKLDTKYMVKNAEVQVSDDLEEDLEEDIGNQATASTGSGLDLVYQTKDIRQEIKM